MLNWLLTFIAYGAIMFAIVIIYYGLKINNAGCNRDCRQGRNCDCEEK